MKIDSPAIPGRCSRQGSRPTLSESTSASEGFTLVELLVVIFIIVILISLLFPVVKGVRNASYAASSQSQIASIAGAIQRYYSDFSAYPGPFGYSPATVGGPPVSQIENGAPKFVNSVGTVITLGITGTQKVTSSENLILGLLGGLQPTVSTVSGTAVVTGLAYVPANVGRGPQNLAPTNNRLNNAYLTVPSNWLSPGVSGLTGATDSVIPEFIDQFLQQMPILYLRARVGNQGITSNDDTTQYNYTHLTTSYAFPNLPNATDFPSGWTQYLGNPSITNAPRGKDTFILIGAGKDRVYGTKDDQFN